MPVVQLEQPAPPQEPENESEDCQSVNDDQEDDEVAVIPDEINDEDHEQNCIPNGKVEEDDVMSPMHKDYDEWMKKKLAESDHEEEESIPKEIPALGPSTLEEVPMAPKGPRLKLDFDEIKAGAGFQDLKNAGKFWRAAQMM